MPSIVKLLLLLLSLQGIRGLVQCTACSMNIVHVHISVDPVLVSWFPHLYTSSIALSFMCHQRVALANLVTMAVLPTNITLFSTFFMLAKIP